jgi:hypothetical protein
MSEHYHDTYTGPRWTYGLTYRPPEYANIPDGWIIYSDQAHEDFRFGIIDYPFELAPEKIRKFELTPVRTTSAQITLEELYRQELDLLKTLAGEVYEVLKDEPMRNYKGKASLLKKWDDWQLLRDKIEEAASD